MGTLKDAKILGGIGSILGVVSIFIDMYMILFIIGIVLVLVAVKFISDEVKDKKIFENYLISFIISIIGMISVIIVLFVFFGALFFSIFASNYNPYSYSHLSPSVIMSMLAGLILAFIILWIFESISAYFLRKCFNDIAKYTDVDLFKTTGLLYLIGALTMIILIGFIILLIAMILQIIAFFSLPDKIQRNEIRQEKMNEQMQYGLLSS